MIYWHCAFFSGSCCHVLVFPRQAIYKPALRHFTDYQFTFPWLKLTQYNRSISIKLITLGQLWACMLGVIQFESIGFDSNVKLKNWFQCLMKLIEQLSKKFLYIFQLLFNISFTYNPLSRCWRLKSVWNPHYSSLIGRILCWCFLYHNFHSPIVFFNVTAAITAFYFMFNYWLLTVVVAIDGRNKNKMNEANGEN